MNQCRVRSLFMIAFSILLISTACAGEDVGVGNLNMFDYEKLPLQVQSSPVSVYQAYQFAIANKSVMEHIPCYCGCGDIGHTSNYACYASGELEDGTPIFDNHALGCSICVDITQDVMRMQRDGKAIAEMKAAIDEKYGNFGPSNIK